MFHRSKGVDDVYAYVRASTRQQVEDGEIFAVQERMIEGYPLMRGMTVARTFVEKAVSGGKTFVERPAASDLVSLLKPGDVVLCAKMDRAFRSGKDALVTLDLFKQRDYDLHLIDLGSSVIKSGVSELIFTIMAGVPRSSSATGSESGSGT